MPPQRTALEVRPGSLASTLLSAVGVWSEPSRTDSANVGERTRSFKVRLWRLWSSAACAAALASRLQQAGERTRG